MARTEKPILSTDAQIAHLQSKGVKFEKISIDEARQYLRENNNYFKLRAYRKNFPKHPGGKLAGQYIDLDFAMLKDLAIIDMRLRYVLIHMALDIEHFAKVKLLTQVEEGGNDGYSIVTDYIAQLEADDAKYETRRKDTLLKELERNRGNSYCGGIIEKYGSGYPVWAFVEIIPLGTFIHFYGFCARQLGSKDLTDDYYLLQKIKPLRNAAAHNNCILHNLREKDGNSKPNYSVLRALKGISRSTKDIKMKNPQMQQMITLLYTHTRIVTSVGVHNAERDALADLCGRMYHHIDFYSQNATITTGFDFFKKSVDILFPPGYTTNTSKK